MFSHTARILRIRLVLADPVPVDFEHGEVVEGDGHVRERIQSRGREEDLIPAYLFGPQGRHPPGGVVDFHQHNGQFQFGKSEVAGLVGDAFQAFGPGARTPGPGVDQENSTRSSRASSMASTHSEPIRRRKPIHVEHCHQPAAKAVPIQGMLVAARHR